MPYAHWNKFRQRWPHKVELVIRIAYDNISVRVSDVLSSPFLFQDGCRCGNCDLLRSVCHAVRIAIDEIRFNNHDKLLQQSIRWNDQQLTKQLIQRRSDIKSHGQLGRPLATTLDFDRPWAVHAFIATWGWTNPTPYRLAAVSPRSGLHWIPEFSDETVY